MKDITPKRFKCDSVSPFCPGAWQDEDGSTHIRGQVLEFHPGGEHRHGEATISLPSGFLEAMFEEWLQNREMAKE